MDMRIWACVTFVLSVASIGYAADAPSGKIDLISDPALKDFTAHFNPQRSLVTDPKEVFFIQDGVLRVSGKGFGYLRTNKAYRDYHLVVEYKWGEHTWGTRSDRARDAGVFVHCQPKDGAFRGTWPHGIEAQLIEGGSGNLNLLASGAAPAKLSAKVSTLENGGLRFANSGGAQKNLEGEKITVLSSYRSSEWVDLKGFRGAEDREEIFGEWNRLEVICQGNQIRVILNGEEVNAGDGLSFADGYVALQSEWAEWMVRRWEIWPLGAFKEEWEPESKSTNTGSGADLLPRRDPLTPEESLASLEVDGPFEVQLVAAEPVVCDPVDVVWDEKGRMFVAEMRDYPEPSEFGPLLSRIRLLKDTNGDGRMDIGTTWADSLDHVQSLLPVNGGILATPRTAILFLKDTDGDDVADHQEVLFQQNDPRHSQLLISCPRWGRDNWIYLNNGLDGKEIYPGDQSEAKLSISRRNIRIHPKTWKVEVVSGFGQFGATLDGWGRRFASTNRNPTIFAVMPLHAVQRNPFAGLTVGKEDIAPFGGEAKVYPFELTHTTSNAHLGTHTAACGLGVYRGNLAPELDGNVFVCEPPGQLVTRAELVPNGASLKAERVRLGKQTEFLRSKDEWFRPVNIRNGPDGGLYICDMYRRFIDHARFFPEEFSKAHYMRAGFDQGRIYRVVAKGAEPSRFQFSTETKDLIAELDHPNGWHRETAQRLLVERGESDVVPNLIQVIEREGVITSPYARMHAMWTLQALEPSALRSEVLLKLLADEQPEVIENAIEIAEERVETDLQILARLVELTKHDSGRVRFLAAIAIGGVDSPAHHEGAGRFGSPRLCGSLDAKCHPER